jgi:FSR family fosmidomycin resistance protein-like MFS transporter
LSKGRVTFALVVLAMLVFSKYFYMASLTSYFTFYLIENSACRWPVPSCICSCSSRRGRGHLFRRADRRPDRRKAVIWFSILGAAPFTLALPYVDLFWTAVLSVVIGLSSPRRSRPSWCTPRNWCRATWA